MAETKKVTEQDLKKEIIQLRSEVQQLREMVNMLLDIVMEYENLEEPETEFGELSMDKHNRKFSMGM